MHGPEHWHCGQAPHTEIEIRQAELDVLYARQNEEDRRARFEEAPVPESATSNAARLVRLVPGQRPLF